MPLRSTAQRTTPDTASGAYSLRLSVVLAGTAGFRGWIVKALIETVL
jgi:hypothetical protein